MKLIPAPPIPTVEYQRFSKKVKESLTKGYIQPIEDSLHKVELQNAAYNSPLSHVLEDIKSGKIYFRDGYLRGSFSAVTVKELKDAGYVWQNGAFKVDLRQSPDIASAVAVKREEELEKAAALLLLLYLLRQKPKDLDDVPVTDYGKKMQDYLTKVLTKEKPVPPAILPDIIEIIKKQKEEYEKVKDQIEQETKQKIEDEKFETSDDSIFESINEDIKLSMGGYIDKRLEYLSKDIQKIINSGENVQEKIDARISREKIICQNKADYISRRALNLARTYATREAGLKAGTTKYLWVTRDDDRVRPKDLKEREEGWDHRYLHKTIQDWNNPPMTNFVKQTRAHPAEDPNCRCVALIAFVE